MILSAGCPLPLDYQREPLARQLSKTCCAAGSENGVSHLQFRRIQTINIYPYMAVCQNLVPLVNIKIAGKWMFIPLKMVLIGIGPYPYKPIYEKLNICPIKIAVLVTSM